MKNPNVPPPNKERLSEHLAAFAALGAAIFVLDAGLSLAGSETALSTDAAADFMLLG